MVAHITEGNSYALVSREHHTEREMWGTLRIQLSWITHQHVLMHVSGVPDEGNGAHTETCPQGRGAAESPHLVCVVEHGDRSWRGGSKPLVHSGDIKGQVEGCKHQAHISQGGRHDVHVWRRVDV